MHERDVPPGAQVEREEPPGVRCGDAAPRVAGHDLVGALGAQRPGREHVVGEVVEADAVRPIGQMLDEEHRRAVRGHGLHLKATGQRDATRDAARACFDDAYGRGPTCPPRQHEPPARGRDRLEAPAPRHVEGAARRARAGVVGHDVRAPGMRVSRVEGVAVGGGQAPRQAKPLARRGHVVGEQRSGGPERAHDEELLRGGAGGSGAAAVRAAATRQGRRRDRDREQASQRVTSIIAASTPPGPERFRRRARPPVVATRRAEKTRPAR